MGDPMDYDDSEFVTCPRCSGFGTVNCHCGGDQCYCDNHGDAPCPVCDEEGEVTTDRWDQWVWEKMGARDGCPLATMRLEHVAHADDTTRETHAIIVAGQDTGIRTITVRGPGTYRATITADGESATVDSEDALHRAVIEIAEAWRQDRKGTAMKQAEVERRIDALTLNPCRLCGSKPEFDPGLDDEEGNCIGTCFISCPGRIPPDYEECEAEFFEADTPEEAARLWNASTLPPRHPITKGIE